MKIENVSEFIAIRHHLHQIPELAYQEEKTSALIKAKLIEFGYEVSDGIAKTGLVALLRTGRAGRTIAFRAEMDALPIAEEPHLPYRSQHEGVMHACGHDGHMATLLLVAKELQTVKERLSGTIKLIFQPAEEGGKGSLAMIGEGVLESPKVDAIFGFHSWPGLPECAIATRRGALLAASGRFEMAVQEGRVERIRQLSEQLDPSRAAIKLLPTRDGEDRLVGLYYVASSDALELVKQRIHRICQETHFRGFHPATISSADELAYVYQAARKLYGPRQALQLASCQMAADDFSEYLQRIPGCYFLVGAGEEAPPVHTSRFDFNDQIIPVAAGLLCQIALEYP